MPETARSNQPGLHQQEKAQNRLNGELFTRQNTSEWFWRRDGNRGLRPLGNLQNMYLSSVGRNATLVLGLTPNTDGLIPTSDAERCRELGDWVKRTFHVKPLAQTSGKGDSLTLELPASASTAPALYAVLKEDIREGERVREYVLEREDGDKWIECKRGTNIGHKRIIAFKPEGSKQLRLRITQSTAEPIVSLAVFKKENP